MFKVFAKYSLINRNYAHPGQNRDILFQPGYNYINVMRTTLSHGSTLSWRYEPQTT